MPGLTPKRTRDHSNKGFNATAFYQVLSSIVEARSVTWRQVARETGITPSTLTRMGQGRQPDAASLAALSAWAGLNPADFIGQRSPAARAHALEVIARALRSDPDLPPEAAKALEEIMRIAYGCFSRPSVPLTAARSATAATGKPSGSQLTPAKLADRS